MLKAMIVDDEAPARSELRFLLDEEGNTEVVAEAASVSEAIEKLKEYPCDVVFLDINMPEVNGLKFAAGLQCLTSPPAVVFVSAYSEYALEAFQVKAVDYLVKPVETERLAQALAHVRDNVNLRIAAQKSQRIAVEKNGNKMFIPIDSIRYVMARDDYSLLHTDNDRYYSPLSLTQFEKRYEAHGFFRVHRGYLINVSFVQSVTPQQGGTLLVSMRGSDEAIPVSRRRASALKRALGM